MIKVGIIGEHPYNDSKPIKTILEKEYEDKEVQFFVLLRNIRGSQLDKNGKPSRKALAELKEVFRTKKLNFVIYVRDLDALPSDENKIKARESWFTTFDKEAANGKGIFLLNIYELEALILADINTFNQLYSVSISFTGNPMYQAEPKELLKEKTAKSPRGKYREADAMDIFEQLDTEKIKNHQQYKQFIEQLNQRF